MPKKAAAAAASNDTEQDTDHLPSTNGSQHEMHEFLRNFDDASACLSPEEVYFLSMGAVLTGSAKTAVMSVKHSILLRAGYIADQKYGVLKPLPNDGYDALYSQAIASVAGGTPIPNSAVIDALPPQPTADDDLPDNHMVAPDRIALVDIKLKSTKSRKTFSPVSTAWRHVARGAVAGNGRPRRGHGSAVGASGRGSLTERPPSR